MDQGFRSLLTLLELFDEGSVYGNALVATSSSQGGLKRLQGTYYIHCRHFTYSPSGEVCEGRDISRPPICQQQKQKLTILTSFAFVGHGPWDSTVLSQLSKSSKMVALVQFCTRRPRGAEGPLQPFDFVTVAKQDSNIRFIMH